MTYWRQEAAAMCVEVEVLLLLLPTSRLLCGSRRTGAGTLLCRGCLRCVVALALGWLVRVGWSVGVGWMGGWVVGWLGLVSWLVG